MAQFCRFLFSPEYSAVQQLPWMTYSGESALSAWKAVLPGRPRVAARLVVKQNALLTERNGRGCCDAYHALFLAQCSARKKR